MQAEELWREARGLLQQALSEGDGALAIKRAQMLLAHGRATDISFCATAFRKAEAALLASGHRKLKTFVVRSVTVEPILPSLQVEAVLNGYVLDLEVGGYGSYMEEMLLPELGPGRAQAELVFVLLDTDELAGSLADLCARGDSEGIATEIEACAARVSQMLHTFRAAAGGRLVVQGCVLPGETSLGPVGDANLENSFLDALRVLNRLLAGVCRTVPDCAFFDADRTAAEFGRQQWRDDRMFLASRLSVAPGAFRSYAHGLMRTASSLFRAPRKVLCTDLDNTFWGGVLGEDGPSGIATGQAFPGSCFFAYQRYLKDLSKRGILLAVTSKNNEDDVAEAFRVRSADLALSLDDFVLRKVGWYEKADALREMAAELSLGLDSFVFVDDNPTECEAIRRHLPEVAVVQVDAEAPWDTVKLLAQQWYFDAVAVTTDDRNRSGEYRAQAQRAALQGEVSSREEFLSSLGIVCTFLSATEAPLERAVQLLAKTNQFNLTTRRHTAAEVLRFAQDPGCQALAIRVRDRFGDAGVVGLALTREQGDACWIDSLLLSCRVIGRGIESALLSQVAEHAARRGRRWLVGEYIETKKNAPARSFYAEHGFSVEAAPAEGGALVYRLSLAGTLPESPAWLTLEGSESYELGKHTVVTA